MAFSTAESSPSTLTLSGGMAVGGSSGYPALLNFNLGSGSVDTIAASGILTVNAGGAIVGLNQLPGTPILPGTYNLITFGSGSGLGGLTFPGGATTSTKTATFSTSRARRAPSNCRSITPPVNAYWTGAQGTSSWSTLVSGSNTNWGSTAGGPDTNAIPGGNVTNVFFTASAASNYMNTTLDGNFSINSLTFNSNSTGPITIGPGSSSAYTLTIYGSNGITVDAGAGAATISAPLVLGVAQTWANNSSSPLTISGSVTNGGNTLTLAGSGNMHDLCRDRRQRRPGEQQFRHRHVERCEHLPGADPGRRCGLVAGQFQRASEQHLRQRRGQRPGIRAGHRLLRPRRPEREATTWPCPTRAGRA